MAKVTIEIEDRVYPEGDGFHYHIGFDPTKRSGEIPTYAQELGMLIQAALEKAPKVGGL